MEYEANFLVVIWKDIKFSLEFFRFLLTISVWQGSSRPAKQGDPPKPGHSDPAALRASARCKKGRKHAMFPKTLFTSSWGTLPTQRANRNAADASQLREMPPSKECGFYCQGLTRAPRSSDLGAFRVPSTEAGVGDKSRKRMGIGKFCAPNGVFSRAPTADTGTPVGQCPTQARACPRDPRGGAHCAVFLG
jgi:hypothetical protein